MQNPIFVNTSRLYKTLCPYVALDPFKNNFIYSWLCWVFTDVQAFSLVVLHRLLIAVASLFVEHGLWAVGLSS